MTQERKEWEKPELIIIDRCYKEESVLLGCQSPFAGNPTCQNAERDGSQS